MYRIYSKTKRMLNEEKQGESRPPVRHTRTGVRENRMHLSACDHAQAGGLVDEVRPKIRNSLRRSGFSLVELMVVVSIIALLACLLLPALKSAKDMANQIKCAGVMKQAGLGFAFYVEDYHRFPSLWNSTTNTGTTGAIAWYNQFIPYGIDTLGTVSQAGMETAKFKYPMTCPSKTWDFSIATTLSCYGYNGEWFTGGKGQDKYIGYSSLMVLADCDASYAYSPWSANQYNLPNSVIRMRHGNYHTANVLFADMHVDTRRTSEIPYGHQYMSDLRYNNNPILFPTFSFAEDAFWAPKN